MIFVRFHLYPFSGVLGSDRSKSERPHPSTFSKRPAKLRYLRTSGSSAPPAASDTTPAHRPDLRPSIGKLTPGGLRWMNRHMPPELTLGKSGNR